MRVLGLTLTFLAAAVGGEELVATESAAALTRTTLVVENREASLAFYRDLMGFEVIHEGPYSGSTFHSIFALGDQDPVHFVILRSPAPDSAMLGLLEIGGPKVTAGPAEPERAPHYGEALLWFTTRQLDQVYRRMRRANVDILAPPFATKGGREMVVADPDGVRMYLFERTPLEAK
jgi:catechol 2,3-dioxygenase-like lactoylglutathione lyase family enzyme